jgi:hypothetical protein
MRKATTLGQWSRSAMVQKWLKKAFQKAAPVGYSRRNKCGANKLRPGGRVCMNDTEVA